MRHRDGLALAPDTTASTQLDMFRDASLFYFAHSSIEFLHLLIGPQGDMPPWDPQAKVRRRLKPR